MEDKKQKKRKCSRVLCRVVGVYEEQQKYRKNLELKLGKAKEKQENNIDPKDIPF